MSFANRGTGRTIRKCGTCYAPALMEGSRKMPRPFRLICHQPVLEFEPSPRLICMSITADPCRGCCLTGPPHRDMLLLAWKQGLLHLGGSAGSLLLRRRGLCRSRVQECAIQPCALHLLEGGCGIETAQEALGHEEFSTTMISPMW